MSAPVIHSASSGRLATDTPVELEHFQDTTEGDPYECVVLHIDGRSMDVSMDDAEALGSQLLMFVGRARASV